MINNTTDAWKTDVNLSSGFAQLRYTAECGTLPEALDKREMFGDQTPSNIVWWPNMLMLKWMAKRLKHVWSNTHQTIGHFRITFSLFLKASRGAHPFCENEFNLHVNEISFLYERMSTKTRFEEEAKDYYNPEMAYWCKPLSKRGTHAHIKHVWYAAVQTNKTSPIKHENTRNHLSFWSNVWWPSNFMKHNQTQLNSIKQHQARCRSGKMFDQQCLMVFDRQTFPVL